MIIKTQHGFLLLTLLVYLQEAKFPTCFHTSIVIAPAASITPLPPRKTWTLFFTIWASVYLLSGSERQGIKALMVNTSVFALFRKAVELCHGNHKMSLLRRPLKREEGTQRWIKMQRVLEGRCGLG